MLVRKAVVWSLVVLGQILLAIAPASARAAAQRAPSGGKVHTYFVAADEVDWDYTPDGLDRITGKPFAGYAKTFVEGGPQRIGHIYRKALYREYTDDTFAQLKPRPADQQYLGSLGPVLRGEVGDTIRVVFKNHASRPYGMHPHGVFYNKDSEGALYNDGTSGADKADDAVPPGSIHVYTWKIPQRAGPGPSDPSSIVWLYHSHTEEMRDVNSGLIGAIIVTGKGMARPDGTPKDVDREFLSLFMIYDENQSHYLDYNIQHFAGDPAGVKKLDLEPRDTDDMFSLIGVGFAPSNFKSTINGYLAGNGPMTSMKLGERVRWYLVTLGEGINFHTPHWHGNVVLDHGRRTDVIALSPAQMDTVDMVPDAPGIWLYHCHISDHMDMGMVTRYQVLP
ncbi:MAG: multicopper oxidase domain-containing protein [Acidobacteriia bacterium]|nr:multicopper oxidase domain-containing protein [Terriglobia bacterium]